MSKTKQKSIEELLEEALVPEEEQPYPVPENWVWVKLITGFAECLDKYRKPVNAAEREKRKGNIPYYGATGQVGWIDDYLTDDELVLVGEDGAPFFDPFKNKAYMIRGKAWVNNHAHILKSYYGTYGNQYLLHYLNQFNYHGYVGGSTRLKLTQKKLSEIPIPLPPLSEQKRIAEKVERLFAKIDEAKRLIEEVKGSFELRWESILDKAFRGELTKKWRSKNSMIENADDIFKEIQKVYKKSNKKDEHEINPPYQIPQNWRWVRLGDIVDINPPKKKLADIEDDQSCTFIPMPSVSDKTGEIENPEIRKYAEVKKGYTFFLENDILFAKITPCMENGKTAIAQNLINGFGFGSTEFHVIRTNPYINTKLIYYLLRSKKFRMEAKKEMTGAVGQQRVPKSFLENYLFPLPPKAEQDKIVELLDKLYVKEVEISKIEALEGEIDSLRQSILNKAFRGELGTNDPTDEHAIELLKEVLKSK